MSAATIRIAEIYDSIQGEGTLAGTPCTLVRLAGCPLRCRYCDTPRAIPVDSGETMRIDDVVRRVAAAGRPLCLVTGGEPLAQNACRELLARLAETSPVVQLETSGALDISKLDERIRRVLDIKTPGSGEAARNRWDNLRHLREGDEIKFVLTDVEDYRWSLDIMARYGLAGMRIPVLLSPAWGMLAPDTLAGWMLRDHAPARLQLQCHKYIWGPEAQGV